MAEWFENDALWADLEPFLFDEEKRKALPQDIQYIEKLLSQKGKRILDLCCGPGRHSLELAKRGYEVTGVDRTDYFLKKAASLAIANGVTVEWVLCDMREFVRPDSFDSVVNLFSSLTYFEDPEQDVRVLKNIHRSLRSGGMFLIDTVGKETLAKVFTPQRKREIGGAILIEDAEILNYWNEIRTRALLQKTKGNREYSMRVRLYSGQEMNELFEKAGFSEIQIFGALDQRPYDDKAVRLVVVGSKA